MDEIKNKGLYQPYMLSRHILRIVFQILAMSFAFNKVMYLDRYVECVQCRTRICTCYVYLYLHSQYIHFRSVCHVCDFALIAQLHYVHIAYHVGIANKGQTPTLEF